MSELNLTTSQPIAENEITPRVTAICIGIAIILFNIIEIVLIAKLKRKRKRYEVLLLSLSFADLFFGLSRVALELAIFTRTKYYNKVQQFYFTVFFYFILTSICHLCWITFDRVWLVYAPLKHKAHVTKRRLYMLIGSTWILTTTAAVILYTYENLKTTSEDSLIIAQQTVNQTVKLTFNETGVSDGVSNYEAQITKAIAIVIIVADFAIVFCYGFIIHRLNFKSKINDYKFKSNQNVSLVCLSIAGIFVAFTIPYSFDVFIDGRISSWTNDILSLNSALNSVVYFFRGWIEKMRKKRERKLKNFHRFAKTIRRYGY